MHSYTCHVCGHDFYAYRPRKYCYEHARRGPMRSEATRLIVKELMDDPTRSYAEVGLSHGVSRQRVGQIARRHGISRCPARARPK